MAPRRLFLDTGVLHRIADGRFDPALVEQLHETIRAAEVQLVLTRELLHDALAAVDAPTRVRFARAVQRFEPFLFVRNPPFEIEPLGTEVQDIAVVEISGLLHAIGDWPPPWFGPATELVDRLHAGISAAVDAFRVEPDASVHVSREHFELIRPAVVELMSPGAPTSTAARPEDVLNARAARAVRARLRVAEAFLEGTGIDDGMAAEFQRHQELDFDPLTSPARALMQALTAEGQRDLGREPRRSDIADVIHAGHFPYVDIATCDAYMFSVLSRPAFGTLLRFPRTPRLIRNGDLEQVIAALRDLAG